MHHDGEVDAPQPDFYSELRHVLQTATADPALLDAVNQFMNGDESGRFAARDVRHFVEPDYELWGIGVAHRIVLPAPWVEHTDRVKTALLSQQFERLPTSTLPTELDQSLVPIAFGALPFDRAVAGEVIIPQLLVRVARSTEPSVDSLHDVQIIRMQSIVDMAVSDTPSNAAWNTASKVAENTADGAARSPMQTSAPMPTPMPDPTSTLSKNTPASTTPDASLVTDTYRGITTTSISQQMWRERIEAATTRLRRGDLDKVVLARAIDVELSQAIHPYQLWKQLHVQFPHAMVFSMDGFVGASPELLVGRSNNTVTAQPMAGTTKRTGDQRVDAAAADELLLSEKNRLEHQITIDMVHDVLLSHCSYLDAQPAPTVVAAGPVQHLATMVSGQLSDPAPTALEFAAELHPTPAVGGFPYEVAIDLMGELESVPRGRYAGPVGWVDTNGNGRFAVGIRSVELSGNSGRLFVGVGVVADSDPDAEYDETVQKSRAMLDALAVVATQ